MKELAKHIASLLLENDCVIIPGFGGFIAHYEPSQVVLEEHLFLPPMRVVGFNPQLRINDGLLAQSYMATYGTTFPDAVKMLQQQSKELTSSLHETGRMEFENVGELRYSIHGKYEFTPFDNSIITPTFYGLDSFKMQSLSELPMNNEVSVENVTTTKTVTSTTEVVIPTAEENEEKTTAITVEMTPKPVETVPAKTVNFSKYLRYAASVAALVALVWVSWFFINPSEQTDIYNTQASILPKEVLQQSMNDIVTHKTDEQTTDQPAVSNTEKTVETSSATTATTPVAPIVTPTPAKKLYNVIVASVGTANAAEKAVQHLKQQGYSNAKAIVGEGKARVSVASFEVETDAYRAIQQYQADGKFEAAWVLRR